LWRCPARWRVAAARRARVASTGIDETRQFQSSPHRGAAEPAIGLIIESK
jgi:hypothetical protein